jgi:hypothetical protein
LTFLGVCEHRQQYEQEHCAGSYERSHHMLKSPIAAGHPRSQLIPHFETPLEKACLSQVADTEHFQNSIHTFPEAGQEIPSHFPFHKQANHPVRDRAVFRARFAGFVGSLADPLLNWVWRLDELRATIVTRQKLSEIYIRFTMPRHRQRTSRQVVGGTSLNNLADPGVRCLLNRVKELVAFDGHIEIWADALSFANAFSHPLVQLRNVGRKSRRNRGCNPAIALRYREIRQRFARLRTANSELGNLYVSRLARVLTRQL